MKFTRKDYILNKCSHNEYYDQFVNCSRISIVSRIIGVDNIKNSTQENFNDITLMRWDNLGPLLGITRQEMDKVGDYLTLSHQVCVGKACARKIRGF